METGADICRYLEWHGTGRQQAPNSTPPPPLLPAGLGASSHPLQLVGEMEVGATATTTYYGVTQQLQEQEASPLLSFSITTFTCLASSELDSQLCLLQCTVEVAKVAEVVPVVQVAQVAHLQNSS